MSKMVIAVDGPAASARDPDRTAGQSLDLARLDTGLIYRAVGSKILRDNDNPEDLWWRWRQPRRYLSQT